MANFQEKKERRMNSEERKKGTTYEREKEGKKGNANKVKKESKTKL